MPYENKASGPTNTSSVAAVHTPHRSGPSKTAVTAPHNNVAGDQANEAFPIQLVGDQRAPSRAFTMPAEDGDNHPPSAERKPFQLKPNNTGLPDNLKTGIEHLSGFSMDDVSVHYNSEKPAQLQALAYAQGNQIHLGPGQEQHLPHEAWHVVQQRKGRVQPTIQMKGNIALNDDPALESEADVMGRQAMQFSAIPSIPAVTANAYQQNMQSIVQRLPQPGVGVELESSVIEMEFKDDHFNEETNERIVEGEQAADRTNRLKKSNLKGKSIIDESKGESVHAPLWSLTAETTGKYNVDYYKKRLAIEIIVHGGGNQKGVKLNEGNNGILKAIGENIKSFLKEKLQGWAAPIDLAGEKWTLKNHGAMDYKSWSVQATAPVPLKALHTITGEEGKDHPLVSSSKGDSVKKIIAADLSDQVPESTRNDPGLLALLTLVASYTYNAKFDVSGQGLKHSTPIMPRTNFVGMLNTVGNGSPRKEEIQAYVRENWMMLVTEACKKTGVSAPEEVTFNWKLKAGMASLGWTDWVSNIPSNVDKIQVFDALHRNAQIGGLGTTTEHLIGNEEEGAPIFEFRDLSNVMTPQIPQRFEQIEKAVRDLHAL